MEPKTAVVSSGMSYAQGVLAYELLTGVHPFYTSSRTKMLSNIRSAESCRQRQGIPDGLVSHAAWYPTQHGIPQRHGIPRSMVSRILPRGTQHPARRGIPGIPRSAITSRIDYGAK
jgi:hypothetical protein